MKKEINVIILHNDEYQYGVERATINDDLDTFYDIIDCSTIDIIKRKINGVYYSLIIDDCGLFKDRPLITLIEKNNLEKIVGNIIVCAINYEDMSELGTMTHSQQMQLFNYLKTHSFYEY